MGSNALEVTLCCNLITLFLVTSKVRDYNCKNSNSITVIFPQARRVTALRNRDFVMYIHMSGATSVVNTGLCSDQQDTTRRAGESRTMQHLMLRSTNNYLSLTASAVHSAWEENFYLQQKIPPHI